jgi:hypothetical protein
MYHFTRTIAASRAVDQGLAPAVTPNDQLQEAGVWLSPNVYMVGSVFGPIGLRVASDRLAGCDCVYIGPKPGNPGRHRFLLLPDGTDLPEPVVRQPTPDGLPNTETACELLLLGNVPTGQLDGVVFGDEQGINADESQLEHARFFAHLLASGHRLVGAIPHPHSTAGAPYGGWWTFHHLRRLLVAAARGGADATDESMRAVLRRVVTHGLGGRDGLQDLGGESVWRWVTDAYATAYGAVTENDLDLAYDRPYAPPAENA